MQLPFKMFASHKEKAIPYSLCCSVPFRGSLNFKNRSSLGYVVSSLAHIHHLFLFLRYKKLPQERSVQERVLVPTQPVGRRERPPQPWRPQELRRPRPQGKAQGGRPESKNRRRKKETLHWAVKTQDRLPRSQRPSSSLLLVNLRKKPPEP